MSSQDFTGREIGDNDEGGIRLTGSRRAKTREGMRGGVCQEQGKEGVGTWETSHKEEWFW
jgi:hypothetical protein